MDSPANVLVPKKRKKNEVINWNMLEADQQIDIKEYIESLDKHMACYKSNKSLSCTMCLGRQMHGTTTYYRCKLRNQGCKYIIKCDQCTVTRRVTIYDTGQHTCQPDVEAIDSMWKAYLVDQFSSGFTPKRAMINVQKHCLNAQMEHPSFTKRDIDRLYSAFKRRQRRQQQKMASVEEILKSLAKEETSTPSDNNQTTAFRLWTPPPPPAPILSNMQSRSQ